MKRLWKNKLFLVLLLLFPVCLYLLSHSFQKEEDTRILVGVCLDTEDELAETLYEKLLDLEDSLFSFSSFASEDEFLGVIYASDKTKSDSVQAVKRMADMGLEIILLTGDSQQNADIIKRDLPLTEAVGGMTPSGKSEYLLALRAKGKRIAMVGDGINDSPSLAAADVGIAIGNGTDIAIESADVVLSSNSLESVPDAIKFSVRTMRIIRENLFWAFFYNVIGIPVAAGVLYPHFGILLSPMIAAACMSLSSIFVNLNALRLARK